MKPSRKDRRSKRAHSEQRLLLTILGPTGMEIAKEIVTTVEVSLHGARVRGIRTIRPDSQGVLTQLGSGQQAPFRVAWQARVPSNPGFLDTGVELLSGFDFWGMAFPEPTASPAPVAGPAPVAAPAPIASPPISPQKVLDELEKAAQPGGNDRARTLEAAWCNLIEQLEERKVFSREELLASLRNIGQRFRSTQEP
ncbi:MAG: hypothetical protein ACRD88_21280 [Terriglobia bacterium]